MVHGAGFLRGDANTDGEIDISDAIKTLSALFQGGPGLVCLDAADSNDDGDLERLRSSAFAILPVWRCVNSRPWTRSMWRGSDARHSGVSRVSHPATLSIQRATSYARVREPSEEGVAVTRETIVEFGVSLDSQSVSPQAIFAHFGGASLPARRHVSPDGTRVTLFYEEPLPASARVRVVVDGDLLRTLGGDSIDGDGDGVPGGAYVFELRHAFVDDTDICGRDRTSVRFGSRRRRSRNSARGCGRHDRRHRRHSHGRTGGDERNGELPFSLALLSGGSSFTSTVVPLRVSFLAATTIQMSVRRGLSRPATSSSTSEMFFSRWSRRERSQSVSDVTDTEIEFPAEVLASFPEFEGTAITVPAGSLFDDSGVSGGRVGLGPVDPNRLPGQLPAGLAFPIVITVQTDGPTNFDIPAPVCFPNLPNPTTGVVLQPGESSALWSFNHDVGRFEIVGPMTVSDDGLLVCTDPGVGIRAPGWHGSLPGVGVSGGGGSGDNETPPPACECRPPVTLCCDVCPEAPECDNDGRRNSEW